MLIPDFTDKGLPILVMWTMEQRGLKNVNNCLYTNIYSYLETSVKSIFKCSSFFQHQF
jgi:hypothetical protein